VLLRQVIAGLALWIVPLAAWPEESIRIRMGSAIQTVPLEHYVAGAVASETYASWPIEALKAQAVVARTYALHERARHRDEPYDVESSVISQRYGIAKAAGPVRRAARETRGQILTYGGRAILAVFHSAAGGQTASAQEVWGEALPYLRSVPSPDDSAPDHFWSYEIEASALLEALREAGVRVNGNARPGPVRRSPSGRVAAVSIGGAELSGRDLREILGGRAIRSALFDLRLQNGAVRFLGSGAGHGVGLSQWGARELALQKRSYTEILGHYYPGTTLSHAGSADSDWSASK
jgi:stage II sporulation protein D